MMLMIVVQGLWSGLCPDGAEIPWRQLSRHGVLAQLV